MIAKQLLNMDPQGNCLKITLIDKSEHFEANVANYKIFAEDCFGDNAIKFAETIASYQAKDN